MSTVTTDQGIVIPVGTDGADNPQAFINQTAGLESRVVLRYASNADRTARNPAPVTGQLSIVAGNTWYDRWTGSKWLPATPYSVYASAEQIVNNSTVLVNSTFLTLPLPVANTAYGISVLLRYASTAVADFKFTFAIPAGSSLTFGGPFLDPATGGGTSGLSYYGETFPPGTAAIGGAGAGTGLIAKVEASILLAGTTGNVTLQFAQNVAEVSNTRLLNASFMTTMAIA
jgi:hypothetical protein